MRQFIIDQLMTLDVISEGKVIQYVDFCLKNISEPIKFKTQNHHILPSAVFPEFKQLSKNIWNKAVLTNSDHYIAHALLYEAIDNYSFGSAWYGMNNKNHYEYSTITLVGEVKYSELIARRNAKCSENAKNKVVAKDLITGRNIKITKEEFDNNQNYVGATAGKGGDHLRGTISVLSENGNTIRIAKEDYDPKIHAGHTKGKTIYKNAEGNTISASKDDPRVISGEYFGLMKGRRFKNPASVGQRIRINIYDSNDNIVFECYGNYKKTCKENGLPQNQLSKSMKHNVKVVSQRNPTFNGWYAKKLTKDDIK